MAWEVTRKGRNYGDSSVPSGEITLTGTDFPLMNISIGDQREAKLGDRVQVLVDREEKLLALVGRSEGEDLYSVTLTRSSLGSVRCAAQIKALLGDDWSAARGRYPCGAKTIPVPEDGGTVERTALVIDFASRREGSR